MLIAYAATRNLYRQLLPSIRSLLRHNKCDIVILCEDDWIPIGDRVINVSKEKRFKQNTETRFTYMTLMRLLLPELVEEDRILYLDVDTIVCDDLRPLFEMDMTGKWWGAVEEYKGKWKPTEHYYNAGVSLFNLKQMREDNAVEKFIDNINNNVHPFPDQDCLNELTVPGKVIPLDVRYNEAFCTGYTDNPAVVHYAGYSDWFTNPAIYRHELIEKYK